MRIGYFLATAVQAGGSFVIVPLLTRVLGPAEYGRWALIEPLLLLGAQVVFAGLGWGILKLVAQDGIPGREAVHLVLRRAWPAAVGCAVVLAAALGAWQRAGIWTGAMAVFLLSEGLVALLFSACRGANVPNGYLFGVIARMGSAAAFLSACLFFGWDLVPSAPALVAWWACFSIAAALVAYAVLSWKDAAPTDKPLPAGAFRSALRYGSPILGASILAAIVGNGDRYVLGLYAEHRVVGDYAVIAKAAAALNLLVTPLNLWWPTARFQHLRDADAGARFFTSAAVCFTAVLGAAAAVMFLASPMLVSWFSPNTRYEPLAAGALCISSFLLAMTSVMNVGTLKEGKTHLLMVTVGVAAAAQVLLALVMVPRFGMGGAALATAISSAISLVFQNALSQRTHPVPYAYGRMALTVVWLLVALIVASVAGGSLTWRCLVFVLSVLPMAVWLQRDFRTFAGSPA